MSVGARGVCEGVIDMCVRAITEAFSIFTSVMTWPFFVVVVDVVVFNNLKHIIFM